MRATADDQQQQQQGQARRAELNLPFESDLISGATSSSGSSTPGGAGGKVPPLRPGGRATQV